MTQIHARETLQSTIVLSNSHRDLLAAAVSGARNAMEKTHQTTWEPYTETPAQRRANERARRIAWLAESF